MRLGHLKGMDGKWFDINFCQKGGSQHIVHLLILITTVIITGFLPLLIRAADISPLSCEIVYLK